MSEERITLEGIVIDEETRYSLAELCRLCGVSAEHVHDMIDEGLIVPQGGTPLSWRFSLCELRRVQTAIRLQRDLRINLPGCALVLDLLEELEELRRLLRLRE